MRLVCPCNCLHSYLCLLCIGTWAVLIWLLIHWIMENIKFLSLAKQLGTYFDDDMLAYSLCGYHLFTYPYVFMFSRKRVGGLKLEELPGLEALKIPGLVFVFSLEVIWHPLPLIFLYFFCLQIHFVSVSWFHFLKEKLS